MENRIKKQPSVEDALSNMIDYIGDFIENLHRKDKDAVKLIINNVNELQDKFLPLIKEISNADEWAQEDLMELAGITLLLATAMGIPEAVDDGDDDNDDDETQGESRDSEDSTGNEG